MSILDSVITGKVKRPRRTILYGVSGIGKSTFGSKAPSPIFIQTEDGLDDLGAPRFPVCKTFKEVMSRLTEVYREDHDYKTIAIDSLDWLEKLIFEEVCQENKPPVDSIEKIGYGKGYSIAVDKWNRVINALNKLRDERGMASILIAHCQIEKFDNPAGDSYHRYTPALHKKGNSRIREYVDEVLFVDYDIAVMTSSEGFNSKTTTMDGPRTLFTSEKPSHIAKNRLGMPDKIPFDYDKYAEYFTDSKEKEA